MGYFDPDRGQHRGFLLFFFCCSCSCCCCSGKDRTQRLRLRLRLRWWWWWWCSLFTYQLVLAKVASSVTATNTVVSSCIVIHLLSRPILSYSCQPNYPAASPRLASPRLAARLLRLNGPRDLFLIREARTRYFQKRFPKHFHWKNLFGFWEGERQKKDRRKTEEERQKMESIRASFSSMKCLVLLSDLLLHLAFECPPSPSDCFG